MTDVLAVTAAYDAVSQRLADEGTNVTSTFGWRESARQKSGNTIVWMPGDSTGVLGALGAARKPGRNPRPLATLAEFVTVEITGYDASQLENERAQYVGTRLLFDAWYRALYLAARGTFEVVSATWLVDKQQRSAGATLRVVVAIEAMVPDEPHAVAPTDAVASGNAHLLDVTTPVSVPEEA
jgi:hypothetical protein